MKRTWIVVLLVILSAMPAAAASIILYNPRANENLEIGVPVMISWDYSELASAGKFTRADKFKIVLMQNNKELGLIAENIPYDVGQTWSYVWTAGNYFVSGQSGLQKPLRAGIGTGYSIKFQAMNNLYSVINGPFTLSAKLIPPPPPSPFEAVATKNEVGTKTAKTFPPSISITSPKAGDNLWGDRGVVNEIYWKTSGKMNQNVSVTLLYQGAVVATLATSTPNIGNFSWNTNNTPIPGGMWGPCTLRIRTLDGGVTAVSGEFGIQHIN